MAREPVVGTLCDLWAYLETRLFKGPGFSGGAWRLPSCLTLSMRIEVVQHVCALGHPELIDVALNTLGAFVGYGIWALAMAVRRPLRGRGGGEA